MGDELAESFGLGLVRCYRYKKGMCEVVSFQRAVARFDIVHFKFVFLCSVHCMYVCMYFIAIHLLGGRFGSYLPSQFNVKLLYNLILTYS